MAGGGWGLGPWGGGPWGGGGGIFAVTPDVLPDEGGVILEIAGSFAAGRPARVLLGGVDCPLPRRLGGRDATGAAPGAWPVASADGMQLRAVCRQLPVGFHDLTVQQSGLPDVTLVNAVEVARRDYWTRLHSLRARVPSPPYPSGAIGARRLALERIVDQVPSAGYPVRILEGVLHAISGALLEASSTLYTSLVAAPFRSGSVVRVWSSAAGDVGQIATVSGVDLLGARQTESLVLAGAAVVAGAKVWSSVDLVQLSAFCAGSVTVADDAGTAPERIVAGPGRLAKAAGQVHVGDTILVVDGLYRFPPTGELALKGERVTYASLVCSSTYNAFLISPATLDHDPRETVADLSNLSSVVGLGERMLRPRHAEGIYLDAIAARWGGIQRPAGLDDTTFRAIWQAVAYGAVGTMQVLELVMDAAVGPGACTIVEDLVSYVETLVGGDEVRTDVPRGHPGEVWFSWGTMASGSSDDPRGKTFLCGREPQTSLSNLAVPTTDPPLLAYGVYTVADWAAGLGRSNNYCNLVAAADGTTGAPNALHSAGGLFLAADTGRPIVVSGSAQRATNGIWLVDHFTGAGQVELRGAQRFDGRVQFGTLDVFEIDAAIPYAACPFGPASIGKTLRVVIGGVNVDRVIAAVIDKRRVRVTAPFPAATTGATWSYLPAFGVEAGLTWELYRATVIGSVIHLPRMLPGVHTDVYVDYTAVRSGVLPIDTTEHNLTPTTFYPFYLSDVDTWLRNLLSELTVAGVIPKFGDPP